MNNYHVYKSETVNDLYLKINKNEVFRYLGYSNTNIDKTIESIVDTCIVEIKELSDMKYVFSIFDIEKNNPKLNLINCIIELKGNDISKHLNSSEKVAVMAVTLGIEVEGKIRYYSLTDLTTGIIFDACATALVEELCDYVQDKIKEIAIDQGYNITSRYSPGYGDLSIDIQSQILDSLNTQKLIGLSTTKTHILLPRKSVTAFIGFTKEQNKKIRTCINCNLYNNCKYSKGGESNCAR